MLRQAFTYEVYKNDDPSTSISTDGMLEYVSYYKSNKDIEGFKLLLLLKLDSGLLRFRGDRGHIDCFNFFQYRVVQDIEFIDIVIHKSLKVALHSGMNLNPANNVKMHDEHFLALLGSFNI